MINILCLYSCSVKGTIERYKKAYSNDTGHANSSNELTAQVIKPSYTAWQRDKRKAK